MAFIYTYDDLQALAAKFQCCYADTARKALEAEMYNTSDSKCFYDKGLYLHRVVDIVANFVPDGTVTSYTIDASATLDLTSLDPAQFTDNTTITLVTDYVDDTFDGSIIIASVTLDLYGLAITDLVELLVDAINNGGSGFTAVDAGVGLITVTAPTTYSSLPTGTTLTLQFEPYWHKQLTTTVSLEAGPVADTFTIFQTYQTEFDKAYTAYNIPLNAVYVESVNRLYVSTGAARKANQSFVMDLDAVTDTDTGLTTTIDTGLHTGVYAPGQFAYISHNTGVKVYSLRIQIVSYDDVTGALEFDAVPYSISGGFIEGTLAGWDPLINNPTGTNATQLANFAPPVSLGAVEWTILLGNGYSADDTQGGYSIVNIYEWNEGTGALDYVDHILLIGPTGRLTMNYNVDLNRIFFLGYHSLAVIGLGYVDISVDPDVLADSTVYNLSNYIDRVIVNPVYTHTGVMVTTNILHTFSTSALTYGTSTIISNLNGSRVTFDYFDRFLYIDSGAADVKYYSGFADYTVAPTSGGTLFDLQSTFTTYDRVVYHPDTMRFIILGTIGGVRKLQTYDINPSSTQSDIEASVQTYTPPVTSTLLTSMKYIEDLDVLVIATSTGVIYFNLTTNEYEDIVTFTPNMVEAITQLGQENDTTNNHFWVVSSESTATPTKVQTISLTSNAPEIPATFSGTITPIEFDGDRNCLTNDEVQNIIEQISRFCCLSCKSDADIIRDI